MALHFLAYALPYILHYYDKIEVNKTEQKLTASIYRLIPAKNAKSKSEFTEP